MSTVTGGRAVSGRCRGSSLGGNCGRWALVGVSGSSLASCRAARAWGVPARVHSASSPGFSPSASPARHTSVTRVGRIGGWLEQTTAPTRSLRCGEPADTAERGRAGSAAEQLVARTGRAIGVFALESAMDELAQKPSYRQHGTRERGRRRDRPRLQRSRHRSVASSSWSAP